MMAMLGPTLFATVIAPAGATMTEISSTDGSNWITKTFNTHSSLTGNVLLLFVTRSNGGTESEVLGATWDGAPMTVIAEDHLTGNGRALAWCGYINGGALGASDLEITLSFENARRSVGYIIDFDREISIGDAGCTVTNAVAPSSSITLTPTDANSLLMAASIALDEEVYPMGVNTVDGWTELGSHKSGNNTSSDLAIVLASMPAGGIVPRTFTGVSDAATTTDDWAVMGFELLPT
jgi:hypothetical protein